MRLPLYPIALALLLQPLTAQADEQPTVPAPDLYKRAVANLNEGRWFESAIADLTDAVRQDPANSDYHLALGCAEVDRAGSVAYAAYWTDQLLNAQAQYTKDVIAWQSAQQDPKSEDYGSPAPIPPPYGLRFQMKDNLTYLRLSGKQAVARAVALGQAAQSEWVQAVRKAKTPQARAQAESVGGWGLLYERKLLEYTGYADRKVPGAPKSMDPVAAFQAATKDDPSKAVYWEGLGDAYPDAESDDSSHASEIIHAWQKALRLAPRNTGLLFSLYRAQSRPDPKGALETLKAVAASDPGNSFLQYGLAALLFKQVHYNEVNDTAIPGTENMTKEQATQGRDQIARDLAAKDDAKSEQIASEAITAVEQGNAGRHYDIPDYTPPMPKMLWHAWDYWANTMRLTNNDFMFFAKLRELARATSGYAVVAAHRGDEGGGARAARACVGMGLEMAGDWPIRDESPLDYSVLRALVGIAIASIGSSTLQHVYELTGNATMAQEAAAEYATLKQKKTAYTEAISKALAEGEAADSGLFVQQLLRLR